MIAAAKPVVHAVGFDTIADGWQLALDDAVAALDASGRAYPGDQLAHRRRALVEERTKVSRLLADVALVAGDRHVPWLASLPVRGTSLGLPNTVRSCVFDLDGVLTDSAALHATAWAEAFDGLLLRLSERIGWQFIPFDRNADYLSFIDGRPRLEGVHTFLRSRGIQLPEGRPGDPAGADTAYGIARHKSDALARTLRSRGVTALPGARRYLEAAGHAGILRAVVSGSANTTPMLELAELATLAEACVDADRIHIEKLRSRPAPDVLLSACRLLGSDPCETASFTHSSAGVAAGKSAGLWVVGIGDAQTCERLAGFGADRVAPSLIDLLEVRLRGPAA